MLSTIRIEEKILGKNDELAALNRRRFDASGTYVVTLSGSPGGGKTSLLERVVPLLRPSLRIAVIEGDVETERDGRRIAALDVPVTQIVTNGTCHLNAGMIARALEDPTFSDIHLLFLENVGNLVCPAAFGLGEHLRVVVMSTTEGEDKPLKYPAMFRKADAMVVNKVDLAPFVPADLDELEAYARTVRPGLPVFRTSCTTDAGIGEWAAWVTEQRQSWRAQRSAS
jgi:hydrogenase nickel incorporation protein HypB